MDSMIAAAYSNPDKRPQLLGALMDDGIYVIASWKSPDSKQITIQDFVRDGQSFIPVFSDEDHFKTEITGSGFEEKGVWINAQLFASMLHGTELLVLNPGSKTPIDMRANELKKLVDPARLSQ